VLELTRIKKLQDQVDQIDSQIIQLVRERFQLTHEIIAIKEYEGIDPADPKRDQVTIEKAGSVNGSPEMQLSMMRVFRSIIDWGHKCYLKKIKTHHELLH
jgi:chorismate mutase